MAHDRRVKASAARGRSRSPLKIVMEDKREVTPDMLAFEVPELMRLWRVALACLVVTSCDTEHKRFSSDAGRFTVDLPGVPQAQSYNVDLLGFEGLEIAVYSFDVSHAANWLGAHIIQSVRRQPTDYKVWYWDLPSNVDIEGSEMIGSETKRMERVLDGRVVSESAVVVSDQPAGR